MASWSELLDQFRDQVRSDPNWLDKKLRERLDAISKRRGAAAVIFYASAFLQKFGENVSIAREDINGFMNALYETPMDNGLTLILHTRGVTPTQLRASSNICTPSLNGSKLLCHIWPCQAVQ